MLRRMRNDERWSKLREMMLEHRIYDRANLRRIVGAMLYRMRVGCPWRDLPIDFEITGGEVHDCKIAPEFIEKLPAA
jgi:transposase